MSAVVVEAGAQTPLYYFSINSDALLGEPWQAGSVYLLPRGGFVRQPDETWQGVVVRSNQWASLDPVRPLASMAVTPSDFPFLSTVHGHHQATVAARVVRDPGAFPWRD
jgi:hypothetical protein